MAITYEEDDFVEDLLTLLESTNSDTECNPEILEQLKTYGYGTLLRTKKQIGPKVKIIDVEEVTEDNIF